MYDRIEQERMQSIAKNSNKQVGLSGGKILGIPDKPKGIAVPGINTPKQLNDLGVQNYNINGTSIELKMNNEYDLVHAHNKAVKEYMDIQPIVDYYPRGIAEAQYIIQNSSNFLIYYDPDIDGAVSGDLVRRFLDHFGMRYVKYINPNRAHGFKLNDKQLEELASTQTTVIMVDAGITREEIEHITNKGVSIINIDHHHIKEEDFVAVQSPTGALGVLINNQYPFEPEEMRYLSGGGMVYYVLKALASETMQEEEEFLVGLSLLSDIRPLENQYARSFLYKTYTVETELTEYLIELVRPEKVYGFGRLTFDRNFIDYTFSPKINSLFRTNNGELAMNIFAMNFNLANKDFLTSCREAQNQICSHIIANLAGDDLDSLIFKSVPHTLDIDSQHEMTNFIGLAASQVKGEDRTTILYVRDANDNRILRGSLRGLCDDVDYLGIVRECGLTAEGHKNAFGIISVDYDKLDVQEINRKIKEAEQGYTERKYIGRIEEVNDLNFFLSSPLSRISDFNNYVRDPQRKFIKYTGKDIRAEQRGKATIFFLNGVEVISFEEGLHPSKDLILPVRERGSYIQFYLKPY